MDYTYGAAFSTSLEAIAMGLDKSTLSDVLAEQYPLSIAEIDEVMQDALKDALKQGVEREDVDPSWF